MRSTITNLFKSALYINFIVIEYLALTPQHIEVLDGLWDKQNHFIAFFVLFILLSFAYTHFSTRKKIALLLLVGFQIEATQYFIPGRSSSFMDIVADSIGIIIGVIVYKFICSSRESFKRLL
ncbi:MAG: VanZ family protein [Sulfuricurvum sp.]|nr:VanZ family protein [Sulfuricurvum sp.]